MFVCLDSKYCAPKKAKMTNNLGWKEYLLVSISINITFITK